MPAPSDAIVKRSGHGTAGRSWSVAAALLTAAVSVAMLFLPLISTADSGGAAERQSLLERDGAGAAAALALPVLLAAVPLLVPARHRRLAAIVVAVLFSLGALVSAASVGLFYLPSAALLVVAAIRTPRQSHG